MGLSNTPLGMHVLNNNYPEANAPGHTGVTDAQLIQFAAQGGSTMVRVPMDLSVVQASGVPQWVLDDLVPLFQAAATYGTRIIFEPGQTPRDLAPGGDVQNEPGNEACANRPKGRDSTRTHRMMWFRRTSKLRQLQHRFLGVC